MIPLYHSDLFVKENVGTEQQIQNLNGVAMYLRGKLPPEEAQTIPEPPEQVADSDELDRSVEYPTKEGT